MSEFDTQTRDEESERQAALVAFARRLVSGESGKKVYEAYRNVIETFTPTETMMVLVNLLQ